MRIQWTDIFRVCIFPALIFSLVNGIAFADKAQLASLKDNQWVEVEIRLMTGNAPTS